MILISLFNKLFIVLFAQSGSIGLSKDQLGSKSVAAVIILRFVYLFVFVYSRMLHVHKFMSKYARWFDNDLFPFYHEQYSNILYLIRFIHALHLNNFPTLFII